MAHLLLFKNPEWGMSLVEIDDDEPQLLEIMVHFNFLVKKMFYTNSFLLVSPFYFCKISEVIKFK